MNDEAISYARALAAMPSGELDSRPIVAETVGVDDSPAPDLEMDLHALATELQDDLFADEMYCALTNTIWRHSSGATWHGSWRVAADAVATVRGRGERYIDFYYSVTRGEGTISTRVATAMATLGWTGQSRPNSGAEHPSSATG